MSNNGWYKKRLRFGEYGELSEKPGRINEEYPLMPITNRPRRLVIDTIEMAGLTGEMEIYNGTFPIEGGWPASGKITFRLVYPFPWLGLCSCVALIMIVWGAL